jgi:hypothetical protein
MTWIRHWPTRHTRRRATLFALWLGSFAIALAVRDTEIYQVYEASKAWSRIQNTLGTLGDWLWRNLWMWPLLIAFGFTTMMSPHRHRRWAIRSRQLLLGLVVVAVMLMVLVLPNYWHEGLFLGLLLLGAILLVGLLAAWVLILPRRLAPPPSPRLLDRLDNERARIELVDARIKLRNELRATALQFIAGLAVLAGAALAFQQLVEHRQRDAANRELTRQGQGSERYTHAIDQLGSNRQETRVGAIYALGQIVKQFPNERLAVYDVLTTYLHRRVPLPARPSRTSKPSSVRHLRERAPDAQAAVTVLIRRPEVDRYQPPLNLSGLDLHGVDMANLVFVEGEEDPFADLRNADLRNTDLRGSQLSGVLFEGADLTGADLSGAYLSGAEFWQARLNKANLAGADLSGTSLEFADLTGANLRNAVASSDTTWPPRFDWRRAGVRLQTP